MINRLIDIHCIWTLDHPIKRESVERSVCVCVRFPAAAQVLDLTPAHQCGLRESVNVLLLLLSPLAMPCARHSGQGLRVQDLSRSKGQGQSSATTKEAAAGGVSLSFSPVDGYVLVMQRVRLARPWRRRCECRLHSFPPSLYLYSSSAPFPRFLLVSPSGHSGRME